MRQLLGWLSVFALIGLAPAGWYVQRGQARSAAPDAKAFIYAEHNLGQAAEKIEQMGAILGSYDGIQNDLIVGMEIKTAYGQSYCVQLVRDGYWFSRPGPGGKTQRGACA